MFSNFKTPFIATASPTAFSYKGHNPLNKIIYLMVDKDWIDDPLALPADGEEMLEFVEAELARLVTLHLHQPKQYRLHTDLDRE
jgi:hypothetical protein